MVILKRAVNFVKRVDRFWNVQFDFIFYPASVTLTCNIMRRRLVIFKHNFTNFINPFLLFPILLAQDADALRWVFRFSIGNYGEKSCAYRLSVAVPNKTCNLTLYEQ